MLVKNPFFFFFFNSTELQVHLLDLVPVGKNQLLRTTFRYRITNNSLSCTIAKTSRKRFKHHQDPQLLLHRVAGQTWSADRLRGSSALNLTIFDNSFPPKIKDHIALFTAKNCFKFPFLFFSKTCANRTHQRTSGLLQQLKHL